MRDPGLNRACLCVLVLALASLVGCERESAGVTTEFEKRVESPSAIESGDAVAAPATAAFDGPLAALRPSPWTSWPLENVDPEAFAGWRINPTSGKYERIDGLQLRCEPGVFALSIADGRVVSLEHDQAGEWVTIDHGQGIDSRVGPLAESGVHEQLPVSRGAALGTTAGRVLELRIRVDGVDIDPLQALRQPLQRWPALQQRLPPPPPAADTP